MYLASDDYLHKSTNPSPDPLSEVKMPRKLPLPKKRNTKKRPVKKKKSQHPHDKWVKLRTQIQEGGVEGKRQIKTNADFPEDELRLKNQLRRL